MNIFSLKHIAFQTIRSVVSRENVVFSAQFGPDGAVLPPRVLPFSKAKRSNKFCTTATMAVQFARLALKGCGIPASTGIIGRNIEETFHNLGQLNNPGMAATDRLIVDIIDRRRVQRSA